MSSGILPLGRTHTACDIVNIAGCSAGLGSRFQFMFLQANAFLHGITKTEWKLVSQFDVASTLIEEYNIREYNSV